VALRLFLYYRTEKNMKIAAFVMLLLVSVISTTVAQDPGWPRAKSSPLGKLVYYQPQVDSWNNHQDLAFRMAFSLTPAGGKSAVGVLEIGATRLV